MVQVNKLTQEEKEELYSKYSKKELIDMLITCNDILEQIPPRVTGATTFSTSLTKKKDKKTGGLIVRVDGRMRY